MSEEVRAENCSDFSHVVQSCGRIVHEFYGIIYANKENGKLESNKRMWLYEKIHISILGNRVSVTYSKEVVMRLLHELNEEGKTVIIVTHDQGIIEDEPYVVKI